MLDNKDKDEIDTAIRVVKSKDKSFWNELRELHKGSSDVYKSRERSVIKEIIINYENIDKFLQKNPILAKVGKKIIDLDK